MRFQEVLKMDKKLTAQEVKERLRQKIDEKAEELAEQAADELINNVLIPKLQGMDDDDAIEFLERLIDELGGEGNANLSPSSSFSRKPKRG